MWSRPRTTVVRPDHDGDQGLGASSACCTRSSCAASSSVMAVGFPNRCADLVERRRTSRASSSSSTSQERMLRRWPRPGSYSASKHAEEPRAKADATKGPATRGLGRAGREVRLKPGERLPRAGPSALDTGSLKVAIVVPMTSRGTDMDGVEQSPLWFNLFASFVESVDQEE